MDLAQLVRRNLGDRTLAELSHDCGGEPDLDGLRQLADPGTEMAVLPAPRTIRGLARGLGVSEATVLLAAGESLGLDAGSGVQIQVGSGRIPTEAWTSPEMYIAQRELRFHCENLVAVDRRLAAGELVETAATKRLRHRLAGEVTAAETRVKSLLGAFARSHCVANF